MSRQLLPAITITPGDFDSPEKAAKSLRLVYDTMGKAFQDLVQTLEPEPVLDEERVTRERVAHSLRGMAHNVKIIDRGTALVGDQLILTGEYEAMFASSANPGAGGVTPTPSTHNLLSATHPDTVVNAPTRGSLVVANSTPAWDEKLIGGANTVFRSDGTDPSWGAIDHNYITNRTRTLWLHDMDFTQVQGTTMSHTSTGVAYPGTGYFRYWAFIGNPAVKPQGILTAFCVPCDMVAGTTIKVTVYWTADAIAGGNAVFRYHYQKSTPQPEDQFSTQELIDQSITTVSETTSDWDSAGGSPPFAIKDVDYLAITEFDTQMTGLTANDYVKFIFDRDSGHASDTQPGTLRLLGIRLDYTADS